MFLLYKPKWAEFRALFRFPHWINMAFRALSKSVELFAVAVCKGTWRSTLNPKDSWIVACPKLKSEIWRYLKILNDLFPSFSDVLCMFVHVTSCNRCNLHLDAFPLADGTFSGASTTSVDARTRWASMCKEWSLTSVASCCISRVSAGKLMLMLILRNLCANFLFLDPALGHLKRCQEQN